MRVGSKCDIRKLVDTAAAATFPTFPGSYFIRQDQFVWHPCTGRVARERMREVGGRAENWWLGSRAANFADDLVVTISFRSARLQQGQPVRARSESEIPQVIDARFQRLLPRKIHGAGLAIGQQPRAAPRGFNGLPI
jgi:hypothetical protein